MKFIIIYKPVLYKVWRVIYVRYTEDYTACNWFKMKGCVVKLLVCHCETEW